MSKKDETLKLITDSFKDFADAKDKRIITLEREVENLKNEKDDLQEEIYALEAQSDRFQDESERSYKLPDHLDNIVMASALEKLFENLDRIDPRDIENFVNANS